MHLTRKATVVILLTVALTVSGAVLAFQQVSAQQTPETSNALTITFFFQHNASRLAERAAVTLHYNGFVYLVEGLKVQLFSVERTSTQGVDQTTVTTTITKVGEATTDSNGEVKFSVKPGNYFVKIQVGEHLLPLHQRILVFSDRSVYMPLELFRHRTQYPFHPFG